MVLRRAIWFGLLAVAACNDDENYPECSNKWRCNFSVSSWNQGSSNYWIYGADDVAFYYYDGSLLGQDYVALQADTIRKCTEFDRHDVLSWDHCSASIQFNCAFIKQAKQVYDTRSSATAGKDSRYTPDKIGQYTCAR